MESSLSGVSFASRPSFLAHTQKLKGHYRLLRRGTGGPGEGRERENRGREAGEEIKIAIVCCLLLGII